jgi:hypothetical protein
MRSRTIARNGMLAAIDLAAGLMVGIIASVLVGRSLGIQLPRLGNHHSFASGLTRSSGHHVEVRQ